MQLDWSIMQLEFLPTVIPVYQLFGLLKWEGHQQIVVVRDLQNTQFCYSINTSYVFNQYLAYLVWYVGYVQISPGFASLPQCPPLPLPTSYSMETMVFSCGVKWLRHKDDHPPSSSVEVNNKWSYNSIPYVFILIDQIILRGCILNNPSTTTVLRLLCIHYL